jgi:polar amino acid transport system substrate-binding protein
MMIDRIIFPIRPVKPGMNLRNARRLGAVLPILLLIAIPLSVSSADTPPPLLRLVSDYWPPFTAEQGSSRVAIELVQGALTRAGQPSSNTILSSDFARVVERIRSGEFDGSAALWKTSEREKFLRFSVPYLENRLVLVGLEGSPVEVRSMSELAGKRVGIVSAYAYGDVLSTTTGPELVLGKSDEANLRKLLDGEVDYVLAEELLIHHVFKYQMEEAERVLEVGRSPLVSRKLHFAVRKDLPGSKEIVQRFDQEIRAMMADGSYHRTLDVDWIWADIDGDGVSELVLRGTQAGVISPAHSYDVISADGYSPEEKPPHYVVEGVIYNDWEGIPERYKVEIDRTREPVDPTITLFRF